MKYVAAYAMLVLGGKADPSEADVEQLLKDTGIKADAEHTKRVVAALKGKKFHELVSEGKKKMATSGTVVVAAPAVAGKKEEKKEEKPKEEEVEVDLGAGGLFGDDEY